MSKIDNPPLTTAERQAIFRKRMQAEGYRQRSFWIRGDVTTKRLETLLDSIDSLSKAQIAKHLAAILADLK